MKKKNLHQKVIEIKLIRHIPLEKKTCLQCGKRFMGMKLSKYCSRSCVRKASYWRNPEAYREKRLESYRRRRERATKG